jgi:hypothetical protein
MILFPMFRSLVDIGISLLNLAKLYLVATAELFVDELPDKGILCQFDVKRESTNCICFLTENTLRWCQSALASLLTLKLHGLVDHNGIGHAIFASGHHKKP